MEHIAIIFYALSSFFGIEDGLIAAEKTEVTIYPKVQQIEIRQEGMFTIIQSKKDSTLVLEQWDKIFNWVEKGTNFAKELNNFPVKKLTITSSKSDFSPYLTFSYLNEKDLRTMGIWYNEDKNQFSINNIPQQNIKTKNGKLNGNYWIFNGEHTFSFTIEPFLHVPENYQKFKIPIRKLLSQSTKE